MVDKDELDRLLDDLYNAAVELEQDEFWVDSADDPIKYLVKGVKGAIEEYRSANGAS